MTWEQLTWEILTWEILTWESESLVHVKLLSEDSSIIWNAVDFYKSLFSWILPLLKTIAMWIIILLLVFFVLLLLFNYLSKKWRKRIQKEVVDDLHRRNREEYEKLKKEKENKEKEILDSVNVERWVVL